MRTQTTTELVARTRRLSDTVGSDFVTDAVLIDYLSSEYTYLYDRLIKAFGATYFSSKACVTWDATNHKADLPTDFYKLHMMGEATCTVAAGTCPDPTTIKRMGDYQYDEQWRGSADYVLNSQSQYRYIMKQSWVEIIPEPASGASFCLEYIPSAPVLTVGGTIDGVNGFDDYITAGASMRVKVTEGVDISEVKLLQDNALERIMLAAPNRDKLSPKRIRETYQFPQPNENYGDFRF